MSDVTATHRMYPRSVRPAPEPLGLYLHPGRNDHRAILNLFAAGDAGFFGAVIDPSLVMKHHRELREQITKHKLDTFLDPKTQQSGTVGGFNEDLGRLPWGVGRPHRPDDFRDTQGRRLIAALGDYVLENGFTQALAPTHLLKSVSDDWFAVDAESTRRLRDHLDRRNGAAVPIIYSLAMSGAMFRDRSQRQQTISTLKTVPATGIWLKIDGFGAASSATAVRNYLDAATEFQELGLPIVADHVGGAIGLSLLAFGAVSGLAHGVTLKERFDSRSWNHPRTGKGFAPAPRVYIPSIDLQLKQAEAKMLLGTSTRAHGMFGCNDTGCCPRGVPDMLANPSRHFLYQRIKEVAELSQIPEPLRPQRFLDQHLRPATDKALAAATINWEDETMAKKTRENRKRLDMLRIALGDYAEKHLPHSFAKLPMTRMSREALR